MTTWQLRSRGAGLGCHFFFSFALALQRKKCDVPETLRWSAAEAYVV
jgi:hypothetical protein